jgi:hypothetical protein
VNIYPLSSFNGTVNRIQNLDHLLPSRRAAVKDIHPPVINFNHTLLRLSLEDGTIGVQFAVTRQIQKVTNAGIQKP